MKKIAFGILSVFMVLGSVLLSACTNEVSLSVSSQEVVIYTNDDQKENFKQKEIEVVLENSNAGIGVEVSSGTKCIEIEKTYTTTPKANGKYAFKILTKEDEQSGKAEVKVYSIEDKSKEKTINVSVMTVLEGLVSASDDSVDARSKMFVVKGQTKQLNAEEYFEFNPISANVRDIDWNFEATQSKVFKLDGQVVAEIVGNALTVSKDFSLSNVSLIASFKENSKVSNTVTFDVLNDSTIKNLTIDGEGIIENNSVVKESENFKLKRNNSSEAVAQGSIEINTTYDIDFAVEAYKILNGEKYYLNQDEISQNFNFDIVEEKVQTLTHTYKFNVDTYDYYDNGLYGKYYLVFSANYRDYDYSITTKNVEVSIDTSYTATRIDVYDGENRSIDSSVPVNVFSNYNAGQGFAVKAVVQPENRKIDNNTFRFVVDINQSALASEALNESSPIDDVFKVYYKGKFLTFSKDGSMFVSNEIVSGSEVYFVAVDTFRNVEVQVQSLSNTDVYSNIVLNLFKISDDANLVVTNADDSALEKEVYISSSLTSTKMKSFEYKIKGISSESGLSIDTVASDRFEFSNYEVVEAIDTDDDKYIVVRFSVSLLTSKFDEKARFTFVHLTGKTSETVTISAFVPIESAYIQNLDASSADVFYQQSSVMGYERDEEDVVSSEFKNTSLSKLVLEAGTTIKLKTETSGASLAEDRIKFKYISYEDAQNAIESTGIPLDVEEIFSTADFDVIAMAYRYFNNASDYSSFVISSDRLVVNDSSFKGVIAAEIYGYNEEHEQTVFVRFFTIESVYSVRYLAPNVRTKLLYTTETLSEKDMNLSYVDVVLSLRPDTKIPSYSNDIERLSFTSAGLELEKVNETYYKTAYYTITNVGFAESGRKITFRITANSTNLLTVFNDVVSVTYKDINAIDVDGVHAIERKAEISIEIRNVKRIENVEWMNKPLDGKIYLNLTAATNNEKEFTVSASVLPADANDIKLTYKYFAMSGSASDLNVTTSEVGQTVNVNINTSMGGTGYLYLLPSDMIKNVDGVASLLLYKYSEVDGKIVETPYYGIKLNDLNNSYGKIVDGIDKNGDIVSEFDNYFYNNDGEKVFYKDIVLKIEVVIADGRSQSTRIRLYNQGDLENIDSSLFYEIMNDISFYGWETIQEFKGSIDGNGHTFKFIKSNGSADRENHTFVNILSKVALTEGSGVIENLNFVGFVSSTSSSSAGFIANQVSNGAIIRNCTIDVYNESNDYMPSELKSSASNYTGGAVGLNRGTISNVKVYGLSLKGTYGDLISATSGGIVGCNSGVIENCGYELYNFGDVKTIILNTDKDFGGLIGYAENGSKIKKSYVYDFGGEFNSEKAQGLAYTVNIASKVVSFEECFAYLDGVSTLYDNSNSVSIKNSYLTVHQGDEYLSTYYGADGSTIDVFDENVWFEEGTDGFDSSINFAHTYLRNVLPSATVDLNELNVADVEGKCAHVEDAATYKRGVLYICDPVQTITNVAEKSELDAYNTISIASLFNVTEYQARSLLLTSNSSNVMISSNQIRVVNPTFSEFEVVVHLKTNFAQTETFRFVVVNAIPKVTTTLNSLTVKDGQTIMLQNGKTKNIVYNLDSKIALNGTLYALRKDSYDIRYNVLPEDADYVNVLKTGNVLVLSGKDKKDEISVDTQVVVLGLADAYQNATMTEKTLDICVYNGTTALSVANADGIVVKASKYANFEVYMTSDDFEYDGLEKKLFDNIYLTLKNDEIEVEGEKTQDNKIVFNVDEKLSLEAFWSYRNIDEKLFKFDVVIKICEENKHLIDQNYENLVLFVNAESQKDNNEYIRQIDFVVEVQEIESTSIAFYEVAMRQYKDSRIYYTKSSNILTTVSPSSDMILAATISPAYAKASSFVLTYSLSGNGEYGTVNIARLTSNNRGFYVDANYTVIENGVKVDISDTDRTGDGVYYFRVYVSSMFAGEVDLKFNLEVIGEGVVNIAKSLTVSALKEAAVKVDGSTRTILAKGKSAEVEVTVGADQSVYNLYLENCGKDISLLFDKNQEPVYSGANKTYKATLYAGFTSQLSNASTSGVFYVCATVERTLNGIQEFKTTYATVYLVDFALDLDKTKVSNTRKTATYNGKSYDVLTSYLNDSQTLSFDYTLLPNNYNYDKTSQEEIDAVEAVEQKKIEFKNQSYYADVDSGYYINYIYNSNRGTYELVKLRSQLWFATSESYVTSAYNEVAGRFNGGNGYFALEEDSNGNVKITGKRTGLQLMMLRTTVICQGEEFVREYFFLVQVEVYTDEDSPRTIRSAEEFLKVTEESEPADYILMNDIVLDNYTPINSDNFRSFDGNGYTIHLNSFALPDDTNQLNLALFNNVASTSTLKNLQVNVYNGGQIVVDVNTYTKVNIAGFAVSNKGIIYNSSVVSYYDEKYQTSKINGKTGINVSYVKGEGTDAIEITSLMGIESFVSGFVVNNEEGSSDNYSSISNCRVGGIETYHVLIDGDITYRQTLQLPTFYIIAQGTVSGFVCTNSGEISASYAKNIEIENNMQSTSSVTAGFVVENDLYVKNSFAEGLGGSFDTETGDPLPYNEKTSIKSMGIVSGFVYTNIGKILNSYSNIKIEKSYLSAGFVYKNVNGGDISLCYSASIVDDESVGQMKFCGVNAYAVSQNEGNISLSYYYKKSRYDTGDDLSGEPEGVYGVNEVFDVSTFYGFSFNSSEGSYDGIWEMRYEGLTLVSANIIAFSNRYSKIVGDIETVFYNKNVRDGETYEIIDVAYGSVNNPIIIRNAEDFAKATGKATTTEVSSYKEYYTNTEVLGTYRLVKDIDMSQVAQNADETNAVRLRTTTKTFKGILDGNGFTISNISLGSSVTTENYGLFAKLSKAVIMNIDFTVESVHNTEANIVGALAGTVYNTRILSVHLSPTETNHNTGSANTAVQGNNIVGGVVGIVLGDSYICNVQVENMDVESAYYKKNKNTESNKEFVRSLRKSINIDSTNSLVNVVGNLSYAGAVAGFVDIYYGDADEYAKFSESLTVNDYNVLSVDVSGSVNIYGEVVGGIFGYIGSSTYIYDIDLNLGSEPSHIISKNLFAGGIVGESYGGMYAVASHYNKETQDQIEKNEYNYYNGSSAIKGQETIFSFAQNEEGSYEKINAPLFIGGIAGYMGGGYIYVGYSKLNVISTSKETLAAGGLVGLLGKTDNYYSLDFVPISVSANYLFRDVYASGDVYAKNGCAGGLIGSLEKRVTGCDVAFKNAMALNFFTKDEEKLSTVEVQVGENRIKYSEKVFTLIGKVYENSALQDSASIYSGNVYLINSDSVVQYNAGTGEIKIDTGAPTVGGYKEISNANKSLNVSLNYFGFLTKESNEKARLLRTNPVGGAEFGPTFESYSYARNYSYFIGNGWAEKFWKHEQDTFLPYIELTPRLDVVFWDVYNTDEVLKTINNSSMTVVVRGRISPSINDLNCSDIDLRESSELYSKLSADSKELLKNGLKFRGKIYSYEKYMNTSEGGLIRIATKDSEGKVIGGSVDHDTAGLILEKSLFDTISSSALVDGLKFYIDTTDAFTGVVNTIEDSIVRNVKIFYRTNAKLSAEARGTSAYRKDAAGVLAQSAISTSIMNITLSFAEVDDESNVKFVASATTLTDRKYYYGLIVGYFEQASKFTNITLQNNKIDKVKNVTIVGGGTQDSQTNGDIYLGLYTGYAVQSATAKMEITLLENLENINIIFDKVKANNVYVGGYIGKAENISSIIFQAVEGGDNACGYVFEYEDGCTIENLYQGALVGEIEGGAYSIVGNSMAITLTNKTFKGVKTVNVGGLIGSLKDSNVVVTSFVVKNEIYDGTEENKTCIEMSGKTIFGGVVGKVSGGSFTISNCQSIYGDIFVKNKSTSENVYVGGVVGYVDNATFEAVGSIMDKTNLNIVGEVNAYVGGVAGCLNNVSVSCENGSLNAFCRYYGNISVDAKTVYVGGFAGEISVSDAKTAYIKNFVAGGEIVCENADNNTSIYVGGVVGNFAGQNKETDTINECFVFEDVYVNYKSDDLEDESENRLTAYYFGGIVGQANNLKIESCKSLTSNFNTRNFYKLNDSLKFTCGAICGNNAGDVVFDTNYYCSGVNFAYEEDNQNVDCAYLSDESGLNYYGYNNNANTTGTGLITSQSRGILSFVSNYVEQGNEYRVSGKKLNPNILTGVNYSITEGEWHSLKENIETNSTLNVLTTDSTVTRVLSEKTRFVGNGFVITRKSSQESVYGGLFNEINGGTISNVVISADMTETSSASLFGGVTGKLSENGIIYAVGVNGTVSVGGDALTTFGGLVGSINGGMIGNCYFDGDLEYRGVSKSDSAEGCTGGLVGVVSEGYNSIFASYSSGMIVAYANCDADIFAKVSSGKVVDVVDCYSIIQLNNENNVMREDISLKSFDGYTATKENKNLMDNVSTDISPLTYSGTSVVKRNMSSSGTDDSNFNWYFDKFVNYGYATHGFGFLRNSEIKVFTGVSDDSEFESEDKNGEKKYAVSEDEYYRYKYTKVDLKDLSEENEYYYEILNLAKFNEIVSELSKKFILRYDIDIQSSNLCGVNPTASFVFDARNHALKNYGVKSGNSKSSALFGAFVEGSVLRNLNMTNASVKNSINKDVGILVNANAGKIYNIYVEGKLDVDGGTNAGGVVGSNSGTIFLAEVCVNIESSVQSASGGVAGANSGTISYASSNGMVVNSVVNSANAEQYSTIQGGIVGTMTGGLVEYSYNTNSVLGNYTSTNATKVNSISGGIVGKITSGTIENCANTGLVGSGNYKNSVSFSYAGGIVGYAESGVTVRKCINDGPVQALGKVVVDTNTQNIKATKISGNINESLTNNPSSLSIKVETIFNKGKTRQVYAFGIGYGVSATECLTSTDNIKNDGVIGEITQPRKLVFDRAAILDNDSSSLDFYGKFDLQENASGEEFSSVQSLDKKYKYTVAGVDSYGFTTKLYMVDQITRQYKKAGTTSEVVKAEESGDIGSAIWNANYAGAVYKYDGSVTTTEKELKKDTTPSNATHSYANIDDKNVLYGVGKPVNYSSSSVEFSDYKTFLNSENAASVNDSAPEEGEDSELSANNLIATIIKKFENDDEARIVSVGSENLAVVNNFVELKTALVPNEVKVSQEFDIPANATDVYYSIKHNGKEDWGTKTVKVDGSTVEFTLLYSDLDGIGTGYTVSTSYKIIATTNKISVNNVDKDSGVITLENISHSLFTALKNKSKIGEKTYNSYFGKIGNTKIEGNLSWVGTETEGVAKFTPTNVNTLKNALGGTSAVVEGTKEFILEVEIITETCDIIDIKYTTISSQETINFEDLCSYEDTEGYTTASASLYASNAKIYSGGQINLANLRSALGNPEQIEMGYFSTSGSRVVYYDNGVWSDTKGTVSGNTISDSTFGSWTIYYSESAVTNETGNKFIYPLDNVKRYPYQVSISGTIAGNGERAQFDTSKTIFGKVDFKKYRTKYILSNDGLTIKVTFNGKTESDATTYGYIFDYDGKSKQGIVEQGDVIIESDTWIKSGTIKLVETKTSPVSSGNTTVKTSNQHSFSVYVKTEDSSRQNGKTYYKYENNTFTIDADSSAKGLYEISHNISVENGAESIEIDGFGEDVGYTKTKISKVMNGDDYYKKSEDTVAQDGKTYYSYNSSTKQYTAVTNTSGKNPKSEGWYELGAGETVIYTLYDNGYRKIETTTGNLYVANADASTVWQTNLKYVATEDTTVVEGKSYFKYENNKYKVVENAQGNPKASGYFEAVAEWKKMSNPNYETLFKTDLIAKIISGNSDEIVFIKNNFTGADTYLYYNDGIKAEKHYSTESDIKMDVYYNNSVSYKITNTKIDKNTVSFVRTLKKSSDKTAASGKKYYSYSSVTNKYTAVTNTTRKNPANEGWFEEISVNIDEYVEYDKTEGTFTAKKNAVCVFEYSASCLDTVQNPSVDLKLSEVEPIKISYVVLGDQIYGESFGFGDITLFGNEHMYKVPYGTDAIVTSNIGKLTSLTVAGSISGRSISENASFFVKTNGEDDKKGEIANVKVFGTMRNVKSDAEKTISPVSNSTEGIVLTSSNITVIVLDAVGYSDASKLDGNSVSTQIEEKFKTSNILISGDGGDGGNRTAAVVSGENGLKGGNGGAGGTVSVSSTGEAKAETKYTRDGANGKGGYGGNGANGHFDDSKQSDSKIVLGGAGGSAGVSLATEATKNGTNSRSVNYYTYSGNDGINGFGRIYYNDSRNVYYYLDGTTTKSFTWYTSSEKYQVVGAGNPNAWVTTAPKEYLFPIWNWRWDNGWNLTVQVIGHWIWCYGWGLGGYDFDEAKIKDDFAAAYKASGVKDETDVYYIRKERVNKYNLEHELRSNIIGDFSAINSASSFGDTKQNSGLST